MFLLALCCQLLQKQGCLPKGVKLCQHSGMSFHDLASHSKFLTESQSFPKPLVATVPCMIYLQGSLSNETEPLNLSHPCAKSDPSAVDFVSSRRKNQSCQQNGLSTTNWIKNVQAFPLHYPQADPHPADAQDLQHIIQTLTATHPCQLAKVLTSQALESIIISWQSLHHLLLHHLRGPVHSICTMSQDGFLPTSKSIGMRCLMINNVYLFLHTISL